jgi:Ca2+-dependent lipid-binding protein
MPYRCAKPLNPKPYNSTEKVAYRLTDNLSNGCEQENLLINTLNHTMVEPRRRCYALPAVDLKKKAVGGILSVTLVSARNLLREGSELGRDSNGSSLDRKSLGNFVEIACEDLMRKTQIQGGGSSPVWDETIDMVLHDNTGTVHFNVYEQAPDNVKYDFIGNCEVKVMVSSAKSFCSEKQIASHSFPFNKVVQKLILQV